MEREKKTIARLRKLGFKKGSIIEGDISMVFVLSDTIHFDGRYYTMKVDTLEFGVCYAWVIHFKNNYDCNRTSTVLLNIDHIKPTKP